MRFEIGQEIVCIKKGGWEYYISNRPYPLKAPKYNDINIVRGYFDKNFLFLIGYKISMYEENFAPILNNLNEIKEILKEPIEIYNVRYQTDIF